MISFPLISNTFFRAMTALREKLVQGLDRILGISLVEPVVDQEPGSEGRR
jgi:hypothetical protein